MQVHLYIYASSVTVTIVTIEVNHIQSSAFIVLQSVYVFALNLVLAATIAFILFDVLRRFNNWIRYSRLVNLIPGPKTLPILGNFLQLNVSSTDEFLIRIHFEWVEKYGNIYRFWAGTNPMVAISSPELMEPVLTNR